MALPENHRPSHLQQWERAEERRSRPLIDPDRTEWRVSKRRPSFSWGQFILYLLAGWAGVWLAHSLTGPERDQPQTRWLVPVERPAPAPASVSQTPSVRCAEPDGTVRGWSGNTGFAPRDYFGFLPKCDQGGRR